MTLDKDYAGILVSTLCMIHCLSAPIILALGITTTGFAFLLDEKVHLALVFPIVLFASWSIPGGYRVHQKTWPLIVAITGVIMLLLGLFIEEIELILTFTASLFLIIAHVYNKYFLKNA